MKRRWVGGPRLRHARSRVMRTLASGRGWIPGWMLTSVKCASAEPKPSWKCSVTGDALGQSGHGTGVAITFVPGNCDAR